MCGVIVLPKVVDFYLNWVRSIGKLKLMIVVCMGGLLDFFCLLFLNPEILVPVSILVFLYSMLLGILMLFLHLVVKGAAPAILLVRSVTLGARTRWTHCKVSGQLPPMDNYSVGQ